MHSLCYQHNFGDLNVPVLLQNAVTSSLASSYNVPAGSFNLDKIHKIATVDDINAARLRAFSRINALPWKEYLHASLLNNVSNLLGPDLCIQKKINLSIQMPYDKSSVLSAHTDCNSGDSPFQYNIWIPLTDAYSTNSMFIVDQFRSDAYYKSLEDSVSCTLPAVTEDDFVSIPFGSYLLFPPSLIHGNVINQTTSTRVSVNVRVKSLFSPSLSLSPPDRRIGIYYELWNISEATKWNSVVFKYLSS